MSVTVDDEAVEEAQTFTNALLATVNTQLYKGGAVKACRKPNTPWQNIVKLAHL
jgi:hypothetical protein